MNHQIIHYILEEYSKKDKRIIIKNIKHVSISETRNEGLKYVEGEYIGFVDDDDFIDLNQYEKMYEFAKKDDIDLLQFETQVINENQKLKDFKDRKIIYKDENVIKNINGNILLYLGNENWNKIYKTKIIKKNNITFVPNLGGEDLNFNLKFYPFVKN
jgi:glycosyltransferase involved in cell wall biosynthesis